MLRSIRDLLSTSVTTEQFPYISSNGFSVLDKSRSFDSYISYMLDRTNQMFEYKNLPDTIPSYILELYLQLFGYAVFVNLSSSELSHSKISVATDFKEKPGIYILYGAIGGENDIYLRPRTFTAANHRLSNSVIRTIAYDISELPAISSPAIVMRNDTRYQGLLPLFSRYASQLIENDISIRSAQINSRAQVGISVSTDNDKESALKYLDDLEAGKLGIIGSTAFLEGINISNISTSSPNTIIQLIELQQYLKASWFNELGLNVNFNMKREYMSEEEIAVNTDILLPLVDDMLNCRRSAIEIINKAFNLNITVEKSSAWANKEQEELSALAEAATNGQIPLKDNIQTKIGSDKDEKQNVSTAPQKEVSNSSENSISTQPAIPAVTPIANDNSESVGTETGESTGEWSTTSGQNEVTVTVNVNVNTEEGDSVETDESSASEESEESDDKQDIS